MRRPLAELDAEGRLLRVVRCDDPDRLAATEHYAGLLVPRLVDAAFLVAPDGTQLGMPRFRCLRASEPAASDAGVRRLRDAGRTLICIGSSEGREPLVELLAALRRARAVTGAPLGELLVWATANGARARAEWPGRLPDVPGPGLCLLEGLDYAAMELTPRTTIRLLR